MKLIKLLTVPAVLLLSLLMAVPAFAHHVTEVTFTPSCNNQNQICFTVTGNVQPETDTREATFELFGYNGDTKSASLGKVTLEIPENHTDTPKALPNGFGGCFPVLTSSFTKLVIQLTKVTDKNGGLADLSLKIANSDTSIDFTPSSQPPTTVLTIVPPDLKACSTPPTPAPQTPTPASPSTPTPTANTTVVLAQTGGFDFRLPLIGLAVIVAGLALYLVSVSRSRRSTGQK